MLLMMTTPWISTAFLLCQALFFMSCPIACFPLPQVPSSLVIFHYKIFWLLCSVLVLLPCHQSPPSHTDASSAHRILAVGTIAWRSTSNHAKCFPEESHCELHKQRCMWIKALMLHYHCKGIIGTLIYILPALSIYQDVMRYLTCCYSMYTHVLYITTCYLSA